MSLSNVISYPYPVLTSYGDDVIPPLSENNVSSSMSIDEKGDYILSTTCDLKDPTLLQLIAANTAEFMMEIDCKNSFYRRSVRQSGNIFNVNLPRKIMAGRTSFNIFVVAKENFKYASPNFHTDYEGQSFDIEKGDVLAIFDSFMYDFDIVYSKLKAYSSIMSIRKSDNESCSEIKYLFDSDKIIVEMPQVMFDAYNQFKLDRRYTAAMHASVVQNALLTALLQEDWSSDSDDDHLWKRTIKYRVAHEEQFEGLQLDDKENMAIIAQKLLGNPVERMFEGFKQNVFETDG